MKAHSREAPTTSSTEDSDRLARIVFTTVAGGAVAFAVLVTLFVLWGEG